MRAVFGILAACLMITSIALAAADVHFTVTVPVSYTAESREDSGDKRLVVIGNGALVEFFNGSRDDSLTVVRDETLPIRTCADPGNTEDVCVKHYSCRGGGCTCSGSEQQNVTLNTLSAAECVTSPDGDCATVYPDTSYCP